tara:strand:- start:100 stop:1419 length:1320 start_codon:yes stop_codon:yes gene_type:complete
LSKINTKQDNFKSNAKELWAEISRQLKVELPQVKYDMWIKPIVPISINKKTLSLSVKSPFALKMLTERMSSIILRISREINHNELEISFVVGSSVPKTSTATLKTNSLYSFDSFVVGPSNELAFAASKQVANFLTPEYNPLYIYSNVGLGKTHLLQAIWSSLVNEKQRAKYVTSEKFTNDYIKAIKENKTEAFRKEYRSCDALLIDDIQFLSGKTQTQEGFFHTFNELFLSKKKIIIAGDDPTKLSEIESRLTSRFQSGLVVDIQPPDYETKIAIIQNKSEKLGISLLPEISDYVANVCKVNIRQIESIVNRLKAMIQLKGADMTLETAKTMIVGFDEIKLKKRPEPENVIATIADYFNVSKEEIKSSSRSSQIIRARRISSYILRKDLHMTASASGHIIGNKNHATVLNAVKFIEDNLISDKNLRYNIQQIRNSLNIA